jgi:hypothetical protein
MSSEAPPAAPPAQPAPVQQESGSPRLPPRHSHYQPQPQPQPQSQPYPYPQQQPTQYAQYPNSYGQPFQTYQQYGMDNLRYSTLQQQLPPGSQMIPPPPVTETKKWIISKMALHGTGFVFAIVILGLGLTFLNDSFYSIIMIIMNCVLAAACILWSGAELIVRACHNFHPGIHPGAHVGLCLIIWLAAAIVGGFEAALSWELAWYGDDSWSSYYCDYSWDSYNGYTYEDCDVPTGRTEIMIASTVFVWFLWAIYFIIFVLACIDTSRRNAASHRPIMVVQPGPIGPNGVGAAGMPPMAMAQQPMPMHSSQSRGSRGSRHLQTVPEQPAPAHVAPGAVDKGKEPETGDGVREYYGTAA